MLTTHSRQIFLLSILLQICTGYHMRNFLQDKTNPQHMYWFNKDHPLNQGNDDKWYYCDEKCLAFEMRNNDKDFVVIQFYAPLKERFSACYVKVGNSYIQWSKVTENQFFQEHCGQDYKDWYTSQDFNVTGIYGIGIGTLLTKDNIQKMYKSP